jgi:hypothetical protein
LPKLQKIWRAVTDSDPRLQPQVAVLQQVAEARGGSASESASEIITGLRLDNYPAITGQLLGITGFAARLV